MSIVLFPSISSKGGIVWLLKTDSIKTRLWIINYNLSFQQDTWKKVINKTHAPGKRLYGERCGRRKGTNYIEVLEFNQLLFFVSSVFGRYLKPCLCWFYHLIMLGLLYFFIFAVCLWLHAQTKGFFVFFCVYDFH